MAGTHDAGEQKRIVAFLSNPATHGLDHPIDMVTTHSAIVFLTGKQALKIKRAVRYDYLDFSTLARRKQVLLRELALNKPAAPSIYRQVIPITEEADGSLAIDGAGVPVEYALLMRQFPKQAELSVQADAGGFSDELADRLGRAVATYHENADVRTEDGAVLIEEILTELNTVFATMSKELGADAVAGFTDAAQTAFDRQAPLLRQRSNAQKIRRCHGDLHLRNIILIDEQPVPIDALEFDERLGTCDVWYDFAFLLMDLMHRGLGMYANIAMNSYLFQTKDDDGLALLPLFLGVRAAIRAMVDIQTAALTEAETNIADGQRYLRDAIQYLEPPAPSLIAIGGLSGTGKTTIARALAPSRPPAPGAVHLRSDLERKALFGTDPLTRLPQSAYSADISAHVYDLMMHRAETILEKGQSVVLDATFMAERERAAAKACAARAGVPLTGIWLTAPENTLVDRVKHRTGDASDATADVVHAQAQVDLGTIDWHIVDVSGNPEQVLQAVHCAIPPT